MASQLGCPPALELDEIASYHQDVLNSLRLYFSPLNPMFEGRFAGNTTEEVHQQLMSWLEETDLRSTLVALTRLEAAFRVDYAARCRRRLKDDLSKYFRSLYKRSEERVRLDEDILEGWRISELVRNQDISEIRSAFKFRHWLAHGRYWLPKLGRKYDFTYIHLMAENVISGFPFES